MGVRGQEGEGEDGEDWRHGMERGRVRHRVEDVDDGPITIRAPRVVRAVERPVDAIEVPPRRGARLVAELATAIGSGGAIERGGAALSSGVTSWRCRFHRIATSEANDATAPQTARTAQGRLVNAGTSGAGGAEGYAWACRDADAASRMGGCALGLDQLDDVVAEQPLDGLVV